MVAGRIVLACCALVATNAAARGVSPYLPLYQSPEIERAIERLLILADVPVLKRPIAAATVSDALERGASGTRCFASRSSVISRATCAPPAWSI